MKNKISIQLSDIYQMKSDEFNILLKMYSNKSDVLSCEEIEPKYYLNITDEYDNTPVGMEACWVENSGTLYYFVNEKNYLSCRNEHETDIDFFEEFNIFVYKGYVFSNNNLKYANRYHEINFKIKKRNYSLSRQLHNKQFRYEHYTSFRNLQNTLLDKKYIFRNYINAMKMGLLYKDITIGKIVLEHKLIFLNELNLHELELMHQSSKEVLNVSYEESDYYYNVSNDEFQFYRNILKETNLDFEIYKIKKIKNCFLIKTQNYHKVYEFPSYIDFNIEELSNSLIEACYKNASKLMRQKIEDLATVEGCRIIEEEQRKEELLWDYSHYIEEIAISIDGSFEFVSYVYENTHEIINKNKIDWNIDLTEDRKAELEPIIRGILELENKKIK